jgi:hypothetical protein
MSVTAERSGPRHMCCACFTHNNLPCCNDGHVDHTGAQYVRRAWNASPLLRSVKDNLMPRSTDTPSAGGEADE